MSTNPAVVTRRTQTRHALILAVLAIAGTTFALLQAVVVPALPNIAHALGTTSSGAAWILTVNLLSTAVLTPILGRAGDILGKERVLSAVMVALAAGTLVCAVAPSLPVMLLGRGDPGRRWRGLPARVRDRARSVSARANRRRDRPRLVAPRHRRRARADRSGLHPPGLSYHWLFWLPLAVLAVTTPLTIALRAAIPGAQRSASINWGSAALMATGSPACSSRSARPPLGLGIAEDRRSVRRRSRAGRGLGAARTALARAARRHADDGHARRLDHEPGGVPARRRDVCVDRGDPGARRAAAEQRRRVRRHRDRRRPVHAPDRGHATRDRPVHRPDRATARIAHAAAGGDGLCAGRLRGAVRRARDHARADRGDRRARARARARAELARQPDRRVRSARTRPGSRPASTL